MRRSAAGRRGPLLGLLVAALGLAACAETPEPELPEGAWLAGEAAALERLLERAVALEGTPLGREAVALRERLAPCREFAAHASGGGFAALVESLRCREGRALPEALASLRGDAPLVFAGPLPGGMRAAGTLEVDGRGSAVARARLLDAPRGGLAGLLLPGEEPPGRTVLAGTGALVHARVRAANGLDIAGLVPEESQGSRLFALKSRLFSGAVLDGTWELALYMPRESRPRPALALAVGVRSERAGAAAMRRFLEEVGERWTLRPTPFRLRGDRGACLPRLRLLPGLAPCYVAARGALVLGWNGASLRRALAEEGARPRVGESRIALRLHRFAEADARLRAALAPEAPPLELAYPWRRAVLRAARLGGGGVRLRAELRAAGKAGS